MVFNLCDDILFPIMDSVSLGTFFCTQRSSANKNCLETKIVFGMGTIEVDSGRVRRVQMGSYN